MLYTIIVSESYWYISIRIFYLSMFKLIYIFSSNISNPWESVDIFVNINMIG